MNKLDFNTVEDSGDHKQFETGAVRDSATGKGRFDLITPIGLKRLAKHYENGARKYSERNWEKGIPLMRFLDSALRHLNTYKECLLTGETPEEDHMAAVAWNALGFIHTEEMIQKGLLSETLDDRPGVVSHAESKKFQDENVIERQEDPKLQVTDSVITAKYIELLNNVLK